MSKEHYDVGVIGLGYVGLTLATALADIGLKVVGVEKRPEIVDLTNSGEAHFHEVGLDYMLKTVTQKGLLQAVQSMDASMSCDVYILTVGTPLDENGTARLDFIQNACATIAENMNDGALVMLRSTVKIGTTRDIIRKTLEASGKSFGLAMCPERTLEGKAMEELRRLPQIVGADVPDDRERAARFFHRLTPTVVQMPTYEAAEIVKLVDNTYRDVQFGFANEVARVCEQFGVNAINVIESGKLGYPRTNLAVPGLVGGPCLEKDPHILRESVSEFGLDLEITGAARLVNERQPRETVQTALDIYKKKFGRSPKRITIFGVAFKGVPETNDLRGTMALPVFNSLKDFLPDIPIAIYDPAALDSEVNTMFAGAKICHDVETALSDSDLLLITNNNPTFGRMRVWEIHEKMSKQAIIYDYWNHYGRLKREERGDIYFSVGGIENFARIDREATEQNNG